MSKNYQNFNLIIEPERNAGDNRYRVRVEAPTGTSTVDFVFPFSQRDLQSFVRHINSLNMKEVKKFGGRLFKALFTDEVRDTFSSSLYEAKRKGEQHGLRVRLLLTRVPELANVPWEFLYNASTNRFLSLSVKTPVIRYLDISEIDPPLKLNRPLRILVMIANPYRVAPLDVDKEWIDLQIALDPLEEQGLLKLDRLPSATLEMLLHQLRQEEYHVFHFIGHGKFEPSSQDGFLIFEDDQKLPNRVSGQRLGVLLHDEKLRMAVLNACEGARASPTDSFAGVAQSLVQQGISAVVAMQFSISDDAALIFSQEFYKALSDEYTVDAAVAEARKAIFVQDYKVEWGTPVIYLRASQERVFDIESKGTDTSHDNESLIEQKAWQIIERKLSIEQKRIDLQTAKLEEIERQQQWAALYKEARTHFDEGNWPEALDALLQLRDVTGDYRELAVLIAKVESRTGRQKAIPMVLRPSTTKPSTKATQRWLATSTLVGLFLLALISFAMTSLETNPKPEVSQKPSSTKTMIQPTLTANVPNMGHKKESNEIFPTAFTVTQTPPSAPTEVPPTIGKVLPTGINLSPSATLLPPSATQLSPSATSAPPSATSAPASATPVPASATPAPASATPAPASATPAPASATPAPASATPAPASATPAPASATPAPASATPAPPSATVAPPTTEPVPIEPTLQSTAVLADNATP